MTSKFSIENRELLQRISSGEAVVGIDFGNLIVRELAAFRLAAMDSEPMGTAEPISFDEWSRKCALQITLCYPDFREKAKYIWDSARETQQPALVVPDENTLRIQGIEALEEFLTATTVEPEMLGGIKLTLACCRALKAIIKNKGWADFNDGKPEKVKAETIITALSEPHSDACRAAMLAAAPQSPGSEPATVPGKWIPVSERMPEIGDIVLTAMGGVVNVGEMECSAANCRFFTSVISGRELPATYWMPLPAAPQEEEKP